MSQYNTVTNYELSLSDSLTITEAVYAYVFPLREDNVFALQLSESWEKRWVNWRYETRKNEKTGESKATKVPYTIYGKPARSDSPSTWTTLAKAVTAQDRFDGVGFMFTNTMLGVDLDKCIVDGGVSADIALFLEKAQTYTEISPSGTGLHAVLGLTAPLKLKRNRSGKVECYTNRRYFTFTSRPWQTPLPLRMVTPEEAEELLSLLGYPWNKEEYAPNVARALPSSTISFSDDELLNKMFASKNGANIRTLYNGNTYGYGGDDSAADAALCAHLAFWTGKDIERMKSLWLASPLGQRQKTQERTDYVDRTIAKAIDLQKEVYVPPTTSTPTNDSKQKSTPYITFISDIELLAMDIKVEWLVESLFAKASVNMVSAPPNSWKSWLLLRAAIDVAHGTFLFGKFETTQTNVLIINEEDGTALLKDRYDRLLINGEEPGGVFFAIDTGKKIDEDWAQEVIKHAREKDAGLVILDSLRSLHLADENDSTAMQPIMDVLRMFTYEGITVIFTHHHRKSQQGGNPEESGSDKARGSSAIVAAVHSHLTCVEKKIGGHYLVISQHKLKIAKKIEPFIVDIEESSKPNNGFFTFCVAFTYRDTFDPDSAASDFMKLRIREYLNEHRDTLVTRKHLVELGYAKTEGDKTLRTALQELEEEHLIMVKKYGDLTEAERATIPDKHNHNAIVYCLAPNASRTEETESVVEDAKEVEEPKQGQMIDIPISVEKVEKKISTPYDEDGIRLPRYWSKN